MYLCMVQLYRILQCLINVHPSIYYMTGVFRFSVYFTNFQTWWVAVRFFPWVAKLAAKYEYSNPFSLKKDLFKVSLDIVGNVRILSGVPHLASTCDFSNLFSFRDNVFMIFLKLKKN